MAVDGHLVSIFTVKRLAWHVVNVDIDVRALNAHTADKKMIRPLSLLSLAASMNMARGRQLRDREWTLKFKKVRRLLCSLRIPQYFW